MPALSSQDSVWVHHKEVVMHIKWHTAPLTLFLGGCMYAFSLSRRSCAVSIKYWEDRIRISSTGPTTGHDAFIREVVCPDQREESWRRLMIGAFKSYTDSCYSFFSTKYECARLIRYVEKASTDVSLSVHLPVRPGCFLATGDNHLSGDWGAFVVAKPQLE